MGEIEGQIAEIEPPRGMFAAKLDDKGRLKVPSAFRDFLKAMGNGKVFVTSLDRKIGRIYPLPVWKKNEAFFESYTDDPEAAANIAFTANDLGNETELDSQDRILFSSELRRELGIEKSEVHLQVYKSRIEVLSDAVYQERRMAAGAKPAVDLKKLESSGLK